MIDSNIMIDSNNIIYRKLSVTNYYPYRGFIQPSDITSSTKIVR